MNQQLFKKYVNLMIGDETKKEFCSQINISPEYLSRLLNDKNKTVPSKDLLRRMYDKANINNRLMNKKEPFYFESLLSACGYNIEEREFKPSAADNILTKIQKYNDYISQTRETIKIYGDKTFEQVFLEHMEHITKAANYEMQDTIFKTPYYDIKIETEYEFLNYNDCVTDINIQIALENNEAYVAFNIITRIFNNDQLTITITPAILAGCCSKNNVFHISKIYTDGHRLKLCNAISPELIQQYETMKKPIENEPILKEYGIMKAKNE